MSHGFLRAEPPRSAKARRVTWKEMTMKNSDIAVTIRCATKNDAKMLAALAAATFTEAFGHLYPADDLHAFLAESHTPDTWTRTLEDPSRVTWIAEQGDVTPIGFITVGTCKLPVGNCQRTAGEVQMLYVLKQYQNLRVGSRLMDHGIDWLQAQGKAPLYIGVWSENTDAQRFYGRYGFNKIGEYGFRVGETVDREFILKRLCRP